MWYHFDGHYQVGGTVGVCYGTVNYNTMWYVGENWLWFTEIHDDVITWKPYPRYWPFVQGIRRSLVNSPHKGQWRRALMFSLICIWIKGWVNKHEAGDLRRYCVHYDVIVMQRVDANFVMTVCIWIFHCHQWRQSWHYDNSWCNQTADYTYICRFILISFTSWATFEIS